MHLSYPVRRAVLAGVLAALAAGCGGPKLYPVRGTVVFPDGKPFTGGWIVFRTVDGGDGKAVSADSEIGTDGTFELRSEKPGDGVPAGRYQVSIRPRTVGEGDGDGPQKPPPIDPKFGNLDTSGIELTVEAKPNDFVVTVHRPKSK